MAVEKLPPAAKSTRIGNRIAIAEWSVVVLVGVVVVAIVLGLSLIPRLNAGQKVLNAAKPAFTTERLRGDEAGVAFLSLGVDMAEPIVAPQGGGASEVPAVVAYIAKLHHVSVSSAPALLRTDFPHTTALLEALPLSSVSKELPGLVSFLATAMKTTPPQVIGTLAADFPALAQAIVNLPAVTNNWYDIPGTESLTRFDGTPVRSVPQLRTYFASDVVPALTTQQGNFQALDGTSSVNWIAPLLLVVGIVVVLFGAVMVVRNIRGVARREALATTTLVPVVSVLALILVLALSLSSRAVDGQHLLNALGPAFQAGRVAGDRAGISEVAEIVDLENPIMTQAGGAAAEVPKLIALLSQKTGLSQAAVLAALQKNFPHATALLEALPLSAVSAELPKLAGTLGLAALAFPQLVQTIQNASSVTSGWNDIPGMAGMTRFDGAPVRTVPQFTTYLSADLIPVLETQRANFDELTSQSEIGFLGIIVLTIPIVGIGFGLLMVFTAHKTHPSAGPARGARAIAEPPMAVDAKAPQPGEARRPGEGEDLGTPLTPDHR